MINSDFRVKNRWNIIFFSQVKFSMISAYIVRSSHKNPSREETREHRSARYREYQWARVSPSWRINKLSSRSCRVDLQRSRVVRLWLDVYFRSVIYGKSMGRNSIVEFSRRDTTRLGGMRVCAYTHGLGLLLFTSWSSWQTTSRMFRECQLDSGKRTKVTYLRWFEDTCIFQRWIIILCCLYTYLLIYLIIYI